MTLPKFKSLLFLLLASCLMAACSDSDDEPTPEPKPDVQLQIACGVIKQHSVAVQIKASDAESPFYVHLYTKAEYDALGSSESVAADLLKLATGDTNHNAEADATFIFNELQQATAYVACAVTTDPEVNVAVASTQFTTSTEELVPFEANGLNLVNDGDWYMNQTTNFRIITYTTPDADNGWWNDNYVLTFDLLTHWEEHVMPQSPDFFHGLYTAGEEKTEGTVYVTNCSLVHYGPYSWNGFTTSELAIGKLNGQFAVTAIVETDDGQRFSYEYDSVSKFIQSGNSYGYAGYDTQLEGDRTNLVCTLMKETTLLCQKDGVGRYTFSMVSDPDPNLPYGGFNKHCIRFTINAPLTAYPLMEIATGTYPFKEGLEAYTAMPGDAFRINQTTVEYGGTYYYYVDEATRTQTMGFVREGQITVDRKGDEYTIVIDGVTHLGYKVSGSYTGPLNILPTNGE